MRAATTKKLDHGAREAALEAMRREYVPEPPVLSSRPTIASLARKYGVPYGAALYASHLQGWQLEARAGWGAWCIENNRDGEYLPRDPVKEAAVRQAWRDAVDGWEEFQRVGYCEFWSRRDRRREAPAVDVRAAVVDLAAYRAQRA